MTSKVDAMFNVFSACQKEAMQGIGPKDKKKQPSLVDLFDENKLEIIEDNVVEEKKTTKRKKYELPGNKKWTKTHDSKTSRLLTEPVENWTSTNLFYYFKDSFRKKYPEANLHLSDNIGINILKETKEKFSQVQNMCSPQLIKDYIDWFFVSYSDRMIAENGDFYYNRISHKGLIRQFLGEYNKSKFLTVTENTLPISDGDLNAIFLASRIDFMIANGIVITLNWLLEKKNKTEKEAKDIVMAIIKDAMKEDEQNVAKIVSSTKNLSPYPTYYNKKELTNIFSSVGLRTVDVCFLETAQSKI